jgi:hypothetical protein
VRYRTERPETDVPFGLAPEIRPEMSRGNAMPERLALLNECASGLARATAYLKLGDELGMEIPA